ncbi:MAG TPA: class I SAM-dependent methyltransferase, partial [Pseudomonadales bacterium]
ELVGDPAYEEEVTPLLLGLLRPESGWMVLDAGCGEGRVMFDLVRLGARPVGLDMDPVLLLDAVQAGPVVRSPLPDLSCIESDVFDGVAVSLVLEHLDDPEVFFAETARVTRPGGVLALVANHPIFTAPGSAPVQEPDEVLWRPGAYFTRGHTDEPAGGGTVRFHHRPLGALMTMAADAGWSLERLVEHGVTDAQVARHAPLKDQRHIPRLLGARWIRHVSSR